MVREGEGGFAPAQHLPSMCMTLGSIPSTTEKGKKKSIWSRQSLISQRYSGETEISYSSHLFAYTSTTSDTYSKGKHLRYPWYFHAPVITEGRKTQT